MMAGGQALLPSAWPQAQAQSQELFAPALLQPSPSPWALPGQALVPSVWLQNPPQSQAAALAWWGAIGKGGQEAEAPLSALWAERPSATTPETRQEIIRALEHATVGSDVAALSFAIDQTTRVGVTADQVASALKRKADLEDEVDSRRTKAATTDAETALDSTSGSGCVDMLAGALDQAAGAGVPIETLTRAGARAGAAAKEAWQLRARPEALAAIRTARQSMDMPSLLAAMRRAMSAEADRELIRSEALGVYDHSMAACILKFAARGEDAEVLDLAIEWARQEEVSEEEMVTACKRRAALEQVAQGDQILTEAAAGLATAWRSGNAEVLAAAIAHAEATGVSPEMVWPAARAEAAAEACAEAAAAPAAAPGGGSFADDAARLAAAFCAPAMDQIAAGHFPEVFSPTQLVQALAAPPRVVGTVQLVQAPAAAPEVEVVALHVDRTAVKEAGERQHLCKEAASALKAAMIKGCPQRIKAAIEQAEQAGVSRELVAPARRKLSRLV